MARQDGINEILGTIGNLTFYKSNNEYLVKRKSSLNKYQFYTNERMAVCRDYSNEFKTASAAGNLIRNAIRPSLTLAKDTYHVSRLFKLMKLLLNMDTLNPRGCREVLNEHLILLKGFNFNEDCRLDQCFQGILLTQQDKSAGIYSLIIKSFVPEDSFIINESITHYKFINCFVSFDFKNNKFKRSLKETDFMVVNNKLTQDIVIDHQMEKETTMPVVAMVGIQFFREVNGVQYIVQDRAFNPFGIVDVI